MNTETTLTASQKRTIRAACKGQLYWRNNLPVVVVDGDGPPTIKGEHQYHATKTGIRINHPNAYSRRGWSSIIYHASTLRVEVGAEWVGANIEGA